MSKNLLDFFKEINERNVEITKPTEEDQWGLRIEMPDGKVLKFKDLEPAWQAAVREVIGYIRKNLNYINFQADSKPIDLQFKADGTVVITPDQGSLTVNGKQVTNAVYKLTKKVKV